MKRKTFDNYDYEEAFPVELDRDIQKKARKNTRCRFRTMKNSGKSNRRN